MKNVFLFCIVALATAAAPAQAGMLLVTRIGEDAGLPVDRDDALFRLCSPRLQLVDVLHLYRATMFGLPFPGSFLDLSRPASPLDLVASQFPFDAPHEDVSLPALLRGAGDPHAYALRGCDKDPFALSLLAIPVQPLSYEPAPSFERWKIELPTPRPEPLLWDFR